MIFTLFLSPFQSSSQYHSIPKLTCIFPVLVALASIPISRLFPVATSLSSSYQSVLIYTCIYSSLLDSIPIIALILSLPALQSSLLNCTVHSIYNHRSYPPFPIAFLRVHRRYTYPVSLSIFLPLLPSSVHLLTRATVDPYSISTPITHPVSICSSSFSYPPSPLPLACPSPSLPVVNSVPYHPPPLARRFVVDSFVP